MLIPHLMVMEAPVVAVPAGETLLREGDTGGSAYVLKEGEVVIQIGGREITSVAERGAIFGEMAPLLGRPRGATVVTAKDSSFYVIDDLPTFLAKSPEFSYQLLRLMAQRIDELDSLLVEKTKWWRFF